MLVRTMTADIPAAISPLQMKKFREHAAPRGGVAVKKPAFGAGLFVDLIERNRRLVHARYFKINRIAMPTAKRYQAKIDSE